MKLARLILFVLAVLNFSLSSATHIVGGEMNYRYLGGNNYEIRLTVYRDCFNGVPPFDDPASIGIYNSSNQLVNHTYNFTGLYNNTNYNNATFNNQTYGFLIHPHDSTGVPNVISDPCTVPPTNICYSVCHYIDTINLPPIPGGYHLVYQRCCRNFSIANIVNPLSTGATYDAWIPPTPYNNDSNPVFNAWPPTYICVNQPFVFDHSATDLEGDSLVYQLCDPLDGASPATPMPQPPFTPPYNTVTWQPPYSLANLFGGIPLTINPQTGILTATPNAVGQYVYAVCVIEYRNGVPIGQTRRDFQVNIVVCSNITVSAIQSPTVACGLNLASFTNNSMGASSYFWNFGDNTTLADTSHLFQPSYAYNDTGTHSIMLIAYSSVNAACNDTSYSSVYVYPPLVANFTYTVLPCSRTVVFNDTSSTQSGTPNSWHWNFGDGNTSTQANPTHTYLNNGNYNVTLVMQTTLGCVDSVVINVPVNYLPVNAAFTSSNVPCTNTFNFTNQSTNATTYNWNFGDASTSTQTNPSHTYVSSGNYTVRLIASDVNGCSDTVSHVVSTPTLAQANFTYQVDTCSLTVNFTNASSNANAYSWNFGDASASAQTNPSHSYSSPGNYNVTLIATTAAGCPDTITTPLSLNINLPVAAFTVNQPACSFSVNITNQSTGASSYHWDFGDNTTSTLQNPSHTYSQPGNYTITLIIPGVASCTDTVTQNITVNPLPVASFTQVLDTCAFNAVFNNTSQNASAYSWNFGDASTSTQTNPTHTYAAAGNYMVILTVTDINGCTSTTAHSFNFPSLPVAAFTVNHPLCSFNITINNQSTSASSYNWNFGDNTTSVAQNPSHTYSQPGNYTITLVAHSAANCADTLTQNITIDPLPAASFTQVLDTCNFNAAFNNTSVNGNSYSWNFGDASTSTQTNPTHTYSSAGNYTVTLTTTDVNGCTATTTHSFTFPALPVAAFTVNHPLCTFNVTVNNQSTGASSYHWDFGDNTTSVAQNPSHTYAQPGNYTITLITPGAASCTDTVTQNVTIDPLPAASFTQVLDTCGLSAVFNNTSLNGNSYSWNFGDASSSTQTNPVHTYSAAGNYTVTLTATDVNGCTATTTQSFVFPPLPVSSFTHQPDVCSRLVTFTNTSSNAIGSSWNFGDAATSNLTNPTHTYAVNGNYNVTLITTSAYGCTDTIINPVAINYVPVVATFNPVNTPCSYNFNFTNQSSGASSYNWNFGDASSSTVTNPSHTYASSGNYNVRLIASDANGCSDTTTQVISMPPLPQANFVYQVDTCSLIVTFTNNSANASTYSWNFGDASVSTQQNPVHIYSSTGNYNVSMIATTAAGCTDTVTAPVPLSFTLPAAGFTVNQTPCSFSISLNNQSAGANNYTWNFGDNSGSNLQNPSHTYASPGNYTITLIISGVASCGDTVSQNIIINPLPAAAFIPVPDVCTLTTTFNNNSVNGASYSWNFGDATTSTQPNPVHTYSVSGSYTVILTVTDIYGCTSSALQSFSFPPLPVSTFTYQADLCSRLITFTNNSGNAVSYSWDFGDATSSTVPNPTHTYAANGTYNVTLTSTSASGCTDVLVAPVNVNYVPVVAAFNVISNPCTFYASFVDQSSAGTSYYWSFGDNYFSSQQNPNHTYSAPGNYTISLVATDANGCSDTASQNISLPAHTQAAFSYVGSLCTREVYFTNNSINGNSFYWDFGDASTSLQTNPQHIYATNGNYNVTLVSTSPAGCTDTLVVAVPVNITLPVAAFTPSPHICSYDVNFTNLSVNASQYSWNFGDNTTSNLANPSHNYPSPGSYVIRLVVTTPAGCSDSTANNVGIAPVPIASFTPQVDTCQLTAQFFNTSQNAVNYWWNFGDSVTSILSNPPPHTYPGSGTYNVTLVVQDIYGCRDTLVRAVHPFMQSLADYSFAIDTCEQEVNFFNHSDYALTYLWNFGDGQTSSDISTHHHYFSDGNYPVMLITNPGTMCADTVEYGVDFALQSIGNIYVPNAFTPNSDGKNDIFEVTGYYPCEDLTLYIFNRWGELIYKTSGPHLTWDGNYMNDRVKLEVYVYILEGKYFYQNGTITVIR